MELGYRLDPSFALHLEGKVFLYYLWGSHAILAGGTWEGHFVGSAGSG